MPHTVSLISVGLLVAATASARATDPRSLAALAIAQKPQRATAKKTCLSCHHVVSSAAKIGDRCPYCGVLWQNSASTFRSATYRRYADLRTNAPISFAAVRRTGIAVTATALPLSSIIADRLRDLDDAIASQSTEALRSLLTVNFVQVGKDGRVDLDFDRYIENTITDAVANSVSRKTTLQNVKSVDGEWIATVRVASKRYLPDTKPQYVVSYEQQTWVARGGEPRLRVIKLLRRKGR